MSKCINCGIKDAVGRSRYCSGSCRALYSKRNKAQPQPPETEAQQSATPSVIPDLPADDELFDGLPVVLRVIDSSPDWKKDPAFRRLIYHFKTTPLDQLEAEGIFIPVWRYALEAA